MSDHPLAKARELSAIVEEDEYNLLVDLQVSGKVDNYGPEKYRFLVWNKEEDQAFGVVKKDNINLILSFVVPHLGMYNVNDGAVLKNATKAWLIFSQSMEL